MPWGTTEMYCSTNSNSVQVSVHWPCVLYISYCTVQYAWSLWRELCSRYSKSVCWQQFHSVQTHLSCSAPVNKKDFLLPQAVQVGLLYRESAFAFCTQIAQYTFPDLWESGYVLSLWTGVSLWATLSINEQVTERQMSWVFIDYSMNVARWCTV